jgi:hypothetical protein
MAGTRRHIAADYLRRNEMKLTKILGVVAVAALALMAFASTASATKLELNGLPETAKDVTIKASLKSGTSALLTDTAGFFANTCTASAVEGNDSTQTSGTTVSGPITGLAFTSCKEEPVTVDTNGSLSVENIAGTTNGTVRSIGALVTVPSPFGLLKCATAAAPGTDIGTLTGVASGNATMDISASLNCGSITAKWTGTYTVTSPTGLGVTS